jgi:hypothetical protein
MVARKLDTEFNFTVDVSPRPTMHAITKWKYAGMAGIGSRRPYGATAGRYDSQIERRFKRNARACGSMGVNFSSKTVEWGTPQDFLDKLDTEFHFTVDLGATPEAGTL